VQLSLLVTDIQLNFAFLCLHACPQPHALQKYTHQAQHVKIDEQVKYESE